MHKTKYKIEWRPTSAGWDMPFVDGEEIDPNALKFAERANELEAELEKKETVLEKVLDLVKDWQNDGRNGHCLPTLRGSALQDLENLLNEER